MKSVADVMTAEVRTVAANDVIGPVRDLMLDGHLHCAPVVDDDGSLVGIITSSDLVEEWAPEMGVLTVMSRDVETIDSSASVVDAAQRMLGHEVHHLVVMDRGHLVGVVSSFDLLKSLTGEVERHVSKSGGPRTPAAAGDRIVIRGHAVGLKERHGTIVETRGEDGGPPYVVQWHDDPHDEPHDVLFFPSSDAMVEHKEND